MFETIGKYENILINSISSNERINFTDTYKNKSFDRKLYKIEDGQLYFSYKGQKIFIA